MPAFRWNVRPRYTAGSPAQVDERTAQRVAAQEHAAYLQTLTGVYGHEEKLKAEEQGEEGISELMLETRWGWLVEDLITGKRYLRPFSCTCGWAHRTRYWDERSRSQEPHRRGCPVARATSQGATDRLFRFQMEGR